jgi:DNA-directed RNA polymerase subunit M/transcription elongation factor TFIIS
MPDDNPPKEPHARCTKCGANNWSVVDMQVRGSKVTGVAKCEVCGTERPAEDLVKR